MGFASFVFSYAALVYMFLFYVVFVQYMLLCCTFICFSVCFYKPSTYQGLRLKMMHDCMTKSEKINESSKIKDQSTKSRLIKTSISDFFFFFSIHREAEAVMILMS